MALRKSRLRLNATSLIILINCAIYLLLLTVGTVLHFTGGSIERVVPYIALNPSSFVSGYVWTLVTSMFTHFSLSHLLVNMISLFFIGMLVERIIGRKRYVWFYLISGLAGGLAFVSLALLGQYLPYGVSLFGTIDIFAVGASGALFGLAGLLVVLLPRLRVLVFFVIPMPLWVAMIVLIFGLWALSAALNLPIGNTAHLGGLVAGLAYGIYLKIQYPYKVRMLGRMFA